ncbi:hypothetical protein Syun_001073 [Stephania yunnanensis]|uniref:Growth-regulating factor n=1 Tax=Stephania yunnanensis TaxID=152371 RepID=A0AAP0LE74_9MAGN
MAESSLVGSKTSVISSILAFESEQIKGQESLKREKSTLLGFNKQNMTSTMLTRSTYDDCPTGSSMSLKGILQSTISTNHPNICSKKTASSTNRPTILRSFRTNKDPEPGRCHRTDGKKWRCAKEVVVDQKYCERHLNRGRYRSKMHVECHSTSSCVIASTTHQNISTTLSSSTSTSMAASSGNAQSTNDVNVQRRPKRFHSSINDSISNNPRKWISKRKDKMVITQDLESHSLSHTSLLPRGAMSSSNEMLSPISGLDFHSRSQSMFTNTPHRNLYHGGSASTGFSLSLERDPFNFEKSGNFSWLKGNKLEKSHVTDGINVEGLGRSLGFNCQKLYGASFSPFIGLSTFSSGGQVIQDTNFSRNDLNIGKNSTTSSTSLECMGPLFHVLKDGKLFFDDNPHTSITNDDLKVNSRVSRSFPTRNDKEVMYEENKASSEFRLDQLHIPGSEEFGSYLSMHCINLGSSDLNQQRLLPLVINGSELNDPHQVYPKNFGSPFSLNEHISSPNVLELFMAYLIWVVIKT